MPVKKQDQIDLKDHAQIREFFSIRGGGVGPKNNLLAPPPSPL